MELIYSLLYMLNEMSPYILLGFFIAGLMHAFVPRTMFARHLGGTGFGSVVKAAMIGVPLPLCSCGVLPTAIAMRRNGASRASSTSFLIATPQTGVDSIAATWSLLGPAFAVMRPVAALVTAVAGGAAVGHVESRDPEGNVCPSNVSVADNEVNQPRGFGARLVSAFRYGFVDLVSSIGGWLVIGLIVAALISVYVPRDFFSAMGSVPILSMLVVLVIAIPMYVCATGSIPIAMSLMMKGLSPGTALVLLMAGPAANFASFTLISREMGKRYAAIYIGSIIVGAICFGLMIDYLLPTEWFIKAPAEAMAHGSHHFPIFSTLCSAALVVMLIFALIRNNLRPTINNNEMTKEYIIKGMNCSHCQATVTRSIQGVEGVENVTVDLKSGIAVVEGDHKADDITAAVRAAGFDIA